MAALPDLLCDDSDWQETRAGWQLPQPSGFIDEDQLHSAVEKAPDLLPLAGRPQLPEGYDRVGFRNGVTEPLAEEGAEKMQIHLT